MRTSDTKPQGLARWGWRLATGISALLAACTSAPPPPAAPQAKPGAPSTKPTEPLATVPSGTAKLVSQAKTPREYRKDAASHLYDQNKDRIYLGKLPPQLYAIGVLQVEVDGRGHVTQTSWMRAPKHAPEVIAEIERTVHAAAPYPAPARLGRVTYTDTWLWHRSGTFQLDTLTEGQL